MRLLEEVALLVGGGGEQGEGARDLAVREGVLAGADLARRVLGPVDFWGLARLAASVRGDGGRAGSGSK